MHVNHNWWPEVWTCSESQGAGAHRELKHSVHKAATPADWMYKCVKRVSGNTLVFRQGAANGQASWCAVELVAWCRQESWSALFREPEESDPGRVFLTHDEEAVHHQVSSHHCCWLTATTSSSRKAGPHTVFLQCPLLRKPSIMFTVQEKDLEDCLSEHLTKG